MGKKIFTTLIILVAGALATYYFFVKNPPAASNTLQSAPLAVDRSSDSFTAAVQDVMTKYYSMADAYVLEDSEKVNAAALAFNQTIESIPMDHLKADPTIISLATALQTNVLQTSTLIPPEKKWDEKRRLLQAISDMLFDMLRTVQYKGGKVYQQFCPMAFDNAGANWLSAHVEIRNPYFGNNMLECGEVKDSISFNP
jgi:hypothetical protein